MKNSGSYAWAITVVGGCNSMRLQFNLLFLWYIIVTLGQINWTYPVMPPISKMIGYFILYFLRCIYQIIKNSNFLLFDGYSSVSLISSLFPISNTGSLIFSDVLSMNDCRSCIFSWWLVCTCIPYHNTLEVFWAYTSMCRFYRNVFHL